MKILRYLAVAAAMLIVPLVAAAPAAATSMPHESGNAVEQQADTAATPDASNPYTPEQVCGQGYEIINSHKHGSLGTTYLLYNANNKHNCVTTIKESNVGTATLTEAYLQVEGKSQSIDSGSFTHYAGPVKQEAASTCVKWGGTRGTASWTSPWEHCG